MNSISQNKYSTSKSVIVIIPTLNEEHGIGLTIEEVKKNIDAEIINIDANSVDKTQEIAASLGAKVIKQRGFGKGVAIAQALQCLNQNTKYIVIMDGDYTYSATYIPQMLKVLEKNTDFEMVTGKRFSNDDALLTHFKRIVKSPYWFGNYAIAFTHRILNNVSMNDPLTGLRVIRFDCIKYFQPKAKSFDIEVELNNYIKKQGGKIFEIPIEYRQRLGEKKLKTRHAFIIFMRMVVMAVEDFLLRIKSSLRNKNK